MKNLLVEHLFRAMFIVIGALNINWAIQHFVAARYFWFGLYLFLAIYMLIYLIKSSFSK